MNFAATVKAGDPDRYLATMTAPEPVRQNLMVLYAFNLEIARAPWASAEPMIAEMRLQWWLDAIDDIYPGRGARGHEVLAPLALIIDKYELPQESFVKMIEARQFDIYKEPHQDNNAFERYVNATTAELMVLAGLVLGVTDSAAMRRVGIAAGVANILRAAPELWARGRKPLPTDIINIIRDALVCLDGKMPVKSMPVALSAWRARATLRAALKHPEWVQQGLLEESPAWRRISFAKARLTRRL